MENRETCENNERPENPQTNMKTDKQLENLENMEHFEKSKISENKLEIVKHLENIERLRFGIEEIKTSIEQLSNYRCVVSGALRPSVRTTAVLLSCSQFQIPL